MYSFRAQIKSTFNETFTVLGTALVTLSLIAGSPVDVRAGGSREGHRRLVHHFDFDEREAGNLENLPKFWAAVRPSGFAHFATGAFDLEIGRR